MLAVLHSLFAHTPDRRICCTLPQLFIPMSLFKGDNYVHFFLWFLCLFLVYGIAYRNSQREHTHTRTTHTHIASGWGIRSHATLNSMSEEEFPRRKKFYLGSSSNTREFGLPFQMQLMEQSIKASVCPTVFRSLCTTHVAHIARNISNTSRCIF